MPRAQLPPAGAGPAPGGPGSPPGPGGTRMLRLRTAASPFHARVIAARLGADGILTELRGNLGGPYPVGETSVWVPEDEAEVAAALLLADDLEAGSLDPGCAPPGTGPGAPRRRWLLRVVAGAGLAAFALAAIAARVGL